MTHLAIAVGACLAGFVLLLLAGRGAVSAVPPEEQAWRDPAPRFWRLLGWCGRALAHGLAPLLSRSVRARLEARLRVAGLEFALRPEQLVAGQVAAAALLAVPAAWVGAMTLTGAWPAAAAAVLVGFAIPASWVRDRAERRNRSIGRTLPFYLDVLTLAVEAGANVGAALQHAVDRGPGGPLADEIQRALRDIRAGRTRAEALRSLADRIALPAVANWVAAVIAAEKQGASLGPILRAQADQRRTDRFLRAEALAMKAPVKMLLPLVVCIFPCTFAIVFFPIAVRIVFEGLL